MHDAPELGGFWDTVKKGIDYAGRVIREIDRDQHGPYPQPHPQPYPAGYQYRPVQASVPWVPLALGALVLVALLPRKRR